MAHDGPRWPDGPIARSYQITILISRYSNNYNNDHHDDDHDYNHYYRKAIYVLARPQLITLQFRVDPRGTPRVSGTRSLIRRLRAKHQIRPRLILPRGRSKFIRLTLNNGRSQNGLTHSKAFSGSSGGSPGCTLIFTHIFGYPCGRVTLAHGTS